MSSRFESPAKEFHDDDLKAGYKPGNVRRGPRNIPQEWRNIINMLRDAYVDGDSPPDGVHSDAVLEQKYKEKTIEIVKRLKHDFKSVLEESTDHHETFLHYLLNQGDVADDCPPAVLKAILHLNPKCIEHSSGSEIHPLTTAIQKKLFWEGGLVETIILFMESVKPDRQLVNEHGEGEKCIKEAFEALTANMGNRLRPDLVLKLVNWATEPMLESPGNDGLTPLQRVVMYEQGFIDPEHQPKLVQAILKRSPGSLYINVPSNRRFVVSRFDGQLQSSLSVYRWHEHTKKEFEDLLKRERGSASLQPAASAGNRMTRREPISASNLAPRKLSEESATSYDKKTPRDGSQRWDFEDEKDREQISMDRRENDPDTEVQCESSAIGTSGMNGSSQGRTGPTQEQDRRAKLKEEMNSQDASREICWELQLRCLRTTIETPESAWALIAEDSRRMEEDYAVEFLGTPKNTHLRLDFREHPSNEPVRESYVRNFFKDRKLNKILRYVSLPQATVALMPDEKMNTIPTSKYLDNRLFYFDWLHKDMGVEKILKVIVDDMKTPHSDVAIEQAIGGRNVQTGNKKHSFDVEILQWRKVDLCPETIRRAAPSVTELHLEWSGSNSVLRGWSDRDGLPRLEFLRKIYLTYTQPLQEGLESRRRTENIDEFQKRLNDYRRDQQRSPLNFPEPLGQQPNKKPVEPWGLPDGKYPLIEVIKNQQMPGGGPPPTKSTNNDKTPEGPKHQWLKYLQEFVHFIPKDFPEDMDNLNLDEEVTKNVTVALIDDGVDVFTRNMGDRSERVKDGLSVDKTNAHHSASEFYSCSGHGTLMAKLILAVCPNADIIPYRVMVRPDKDSHVPRPDPESAAKAIKHAIKKGVDVISMSWSVEGSPLGQSETDSGLFLLENAVNSTHPNPIPLMFCSASDDAGSSSGNKKKEYPASCTNKIFRIGAATDLSQTWVHVKHPNEAHFFFPGVKIPELREQFQYEYKTAEQDPDPRSGSSIATALAAGLAALILHCTKLGIYYSQKERQDELILPDDLRRFKTFEGMNQAFMMLTNDNLTHQRVGYPAQRFEKATSDMRDMEDENELKSPTRYRPIAALVRNIIGWRNTT
ncbi:MAG: hypothetical protein M1840_003828 [Geoglossum simile]|nr:MAG: hypothetical protein M1840_003828 [Geoglossum simile]